MPPTDLLVLRQQRSPESPAAAAATATATKPLSPGQSTFQKPFPPVGVPDFQNHHFSPYRRPSNTANAQPSPRPPRIDSAGPLPTHRPPMPRPSESPRSDFHPDFHTTEITRSSRVPDAVGNSNHHQRPTMSRSPSPVSKISSNGTYETKATSIDLPALAAHSALEESDRMEPLSGDLAGSFDLVAPPEEGHRAFSLEARSEQMFSREHLGIIFSNPSSLMRFTAFLSTHRPESVPMLIYYLDALKALKAIKYSNAIAEALHAIPGHDFTANLARPTTNRDLEEKATEAFDALTQHDLPAYITQTYVQVVSLSISRRITGTLAPHLREAAEGLAEVFCLTDPSRPDNPIVFASEEFHRTTQYGVNYAIGRNCRFLQGPKTHPLSGRRLGDAVRAGKEHCEVFLNYRRDGSPFMNMLMIAPLCDSRGQIRYFIGAQVDVSGLVKDCTDMETLQQLVLKQQQSGRTNVESAPNQANSMDDFQQLSEMLNIGELETVRKYGGRMHREYQDDESEIARGGAPHMPRLLLQEPTTDEVQGFSQDKRLSGKLSGIYQNYLLIRPYPSFRILFASPTLRVPGILQSPFLDKISGSTRVRDELSSALAEGRGVTAKVRWVTRPDEDGRNRWIHCTPLIGSNGQIGVWMIVLVDDDVELNRRWKQAPPVAPHRGRVYTSSQEDRERLNGSFESIAGRGNGADSLQTDRGHQNGRSGTRSGSMRSTSPHSVLI